MKLPVFTAMIVMGACLGAQTMSNLPIIVVQPFEEIRTSSSGDTFAGAVTSMMRTAIGGSLIFQTEGGKRLASYDYQSLRSLSPSAKAGQLFLMSGTVLSVNNMIQVDIRVFDVIQDSLVYSSFLPILSINTARSAIEEYLADLKTMVFGNILGKVELSVSAPEADIYLDNRYVGKMPSSLKLDFNSLIPGEYSLKILAAGFMDYQEKITVRERRLTTVNVQLAQEPGSLNLDSDPSGAEVLIDGKPSGTTPLRLRQIQPGSYRVTIKKDLYLDYASTISVRSREERTLNASLTIMPGTARITSTPSGAILLDGDKRLGSTPITLSDLPPRKYVFQLQLQNYVTYPLDINIEPAKSLNMDIALTRAQAPLDLYSTPADTNVYADSGEGRILLGRTPIQKKMIDFGSYKLSLEKEGYFSKQLTLKVDENRTYNIESSLKQKPGIIRVSTDPNNARVFIDGVYRGNSPLVMKNLEPGPHSVEASTSYGSRSVQVDVQPDKEEAVSMAISKPALSFISATVISALSLILFFSASGN